MQLSPDRGRPRGLRLPHAQLEAVAFEERPPTIRKERRSCEGAYRSRSSCSYTHCMNDDVASERRSAV